MQEKITTRKARTGETVTTRADGIQKSIWIERDGVEIGCVWGSKWDDKIGWKFADGSRGFLDARTCKSKDAAYRVAVNQFLGK